jgi:CheY-like chemotaxis protein
MLAMSKTVVVDVVQDGDAAWYVRVIERQLRVLVVDDCRDGADTLATLVETWGHAVHRAYDGAGALLIASAYHPNVVLMDIAMPKMDGCEVARRLLGQERFTQTLFVAITGYADEAHRLLCDEAGFDHWLVKPVEPAIVKNLLQLEKNRLAGQTIRDHAISQ